MNEDTVTNGFVQLAPPEMQPAQNPNSRCCFYGADENGKEVHIIFRPLAVPGFVTPAQFLADIATAGGSLPGELTRFAPKFVLGKFRYRRPGTLTDTETDATEMRRVLSRPAINQPAPGAQQPTPTTTPPPRMKKPPLPDLPTRRPEPRGMGRF